MSRILRILSEAQKQKLAGEFGADTDAKKPDSAAGTVSGRDKPAEAVDDVLRELERLKEELLQLQEEQKGIILSLRDVVDRI